MDALTLLRDVSDAYRSLKNMAVEAAIDVQAVVAYLDSLPPIHNPLPKTKLVFPVSVLIKRAPKPVGSVAAIDKSDPKKYGEFLMAVGGCAECHRVLIALIPKIRDGRSLKSKKLGHVQQFWRVIDPPI
jgi:hypothetical protein